MLTRSREQEAGALYEEGEKAVRAGGHELSMLASHLILMVRGTAVYRGPLWPFRILHDGREIHLDRFVDYLTKPARIGLALPSMHFLRQVLKATPGRGEEAVALVREELLKDRIDFDSVADRERDTELLKRKPGPGGRPVVVKGGTVPPLPKDGWSRLAARLADRRPDLADQVRDGTLKLSRALVDAGIRKPPPALTVMRRAWGRASSEERATFLSEVMTSQLKQGS